MRWRTIHLAIGLVGIVAFVGTGQYMRWVHGGLLGMADGPRLFLRSAHIYLLWSSLLNLLLGCYLVPAGRKILGHLQSLGSLAIALGPLLLTASFFLEPHNPHLMRPMGQLAIFLSFGGVLLHALLMLRTRTTPAET